MAGYPSNLAEKFSPTEQFPQHILPLLLLYNAQWWGYESLTAIVLVISNYSSNYKQTARTKIGNLGNNILQASTYHNLKINKCVINECMT